MEDLIKDDYKSVYEHLCDSDYDTDISKSSQTSITFEDNSHTETEVTSLITPNMIINNEK